MLRSLAARLIGGAEDSSVGCSGTCVDGFLNLGAQVVLLRCIWIWGTFSGIEDRCDELSAVASKVACPVGYNQICLSFDINPSNATFALRLDMR